MKINYTDIINAVKEGKCQDEELKNIVEPKYKIKIYDDNRVVVTMHNFNPFSSRKEWNGKKTSNKNKDKMTAREYFKNIRNWTQRLFSLKLESEFCRFITLTLATDMEWAELGLKFTAFMNAVRRNFGNVNYIRGVEVQKESERFHIHLILVFETTPPEKLNSIWVQEHWKHGSTFMDENVNVYDIYGLMEYLTLFKSGVKMEKFPSKTHFPSGANVISTNIEKVSEARELKISQSEFEELYDYACREFYDKHGSYVREDGHYYIGANNTKKFTLDKVYIKNAGDYIINNFGTAEDDSILAEKRQTKKDLAEMKYNQQIMKAQQEADESFKLLQEELDRQEKLSEDMEYNCRSGEIIF